MVTANISVTKNDIAKGLKADTDQCPIARAIHRAGFKKAEVGRWLYATDNDEPVAEFPEVAQDFIKNFDGGSPVAPFKFTLKVTNANAKKLGYKAPAKKAA